MHGRVPAPADQQQVARDGFAVRGTDDRVRDPLVAVCPGDVCSGEEPDPGRGALLGQALWHLGTGVDDHLDADARAVQVEGGLVGAVVGGEDDRLAAHEHAVAVQEGPGRAGQHDAGTVVVGEHHRTLVGTGRDHDGLRPQPPHPLAGQVFRGGRAEVVGAALEGQHKAVVVAAERGGALQMQDLRVRGQLGDDLGDPVDGFRAGQQRTARLGLLVDQRDAGAGPGGLESGGQPGRSGPDHQHVDVVVLGVVARRVGHVGQPALAGQTAGRQSVVELDGGGQQHRLGEGLLDLDQAARVFGPGGGDAARPAELDAGGDRVAARREQRRGQGVAGMTGERLAVEGEGEGAAAVDAPA